LSSVSALVGRRIIGRSHLMTVGNCTFFFSSRRRHTRSVSAFLLNRSSDLYGTLDFVGYPRFPAPVEFIAAVIAYYVHPVNIQTACLIMEGAEFTENIINGVERPVKAAE